MFTIRLLFFLFIFSGFEANSQELRLNNVTIEEIQERFYPSDSAAVAAYLFKKGTTYFEVNVYGGHTAVYSVELKLKIYKKEGLDYANVEIPYNEYNQSLEIEQANTFSLKENQIVKTKVKKEGIFDQTGERINIKKIIFPDVKEGSIIELKYLIKSYGSVYVKDWRFQDEIPVKVSYYEFLNPTYLVYSHITTPNGIDIKSSQRVNKNNKSATISNSILFEENYLYMMATDIPAFKPEPYMGNKSTYIASVRHELLEQKMNKKFPSEIAASWEGIAKILYKDNDFGKQIINKKYLPATLKNSIKEGNLTDIQKIDSVFLYVRNNIKWNKYTRGIYCSKDGLEDVIKSKSGNFAEVNLLLVAMLKEAGLRANPVLLSTRNYGLVLHPNLSNLNCVIAGVELDDKIVLLDATDKNSTTLIRPTRTINHTGWLIREDYSFRKVNLIPDYKSKEMVYGATTIDEQGFLKGKIKQITQGYYSLALASSSIYENENAQTKRIESIENQLKIEIDNYQKTDADNEFKTIIEEFSFNASGCCDVTENKIYFSPFLFLKETINPFTEENRKYPIDFIFPFQKRYVVIIEFPENYNLEYVPENLSVNIEDGIASYKFESSHSQGKLTVTGDFNMNTAVFSTDYYNSLRNFYRKMIDKQNEKIILTKI